MIRVFFVSLFMFQVLFYAFSDAENADVKETDQLTIEKRRDTIRYGTDNEISQLISTIRKEKSSDYDADLSETAAVTGNNTILTALFSYFGEREQGGLEKRALSVLENNEEYNNAVTLAAIDYLGKTKNADAAPLLLALIEAENNSYTNPAVRAYGMIAGAEAEKGAEIADFLVSYYSSRSHPPETEREIISALGETHSKTATAFLVDIIKNAENRYVLRMAALEAAAKIGDEEAVGTVVAATITDNPNVRSSAIAALGAFSGEEVDKAIIDAFRDSFFRTRLGACEAAGKRKLQSAIPYLRYRALNDETPSVRDEAVRALGMIETDAASAVLLELFENERNPDRIRGGAAEQLVKLNKELYSPKIRTVMEEAKKKNRTALANGMEKALGAAK